MALTINLVSKLDTSIIAFIIRFSPKSGSTIRIAATFKLPQKPKTIDFNYAAELKLLKKIDYIITVLPLLPLFIHCHFD